MPDAAQQMLAYLRREIIRRPDEALDADTPLISSGLIDSFALVDVVMALEDVTGLRIDPGRVQPRDFETVNTMLETAHRVGRPQ